MSKTPYIGPGHLLCVPKLGSKNAVSARMDFSSFIRIVKAPLIMGSRSTSGSDGGIIVLIINVFILLLTIFVQFNTRLLYYCVLLPNRPVTYKRAPAHIGTSRTNIVSAR